MPKAKLTDPYIRSKSSDNGTEDIYDELTPGLILRVMESGTKTFAYRYNDPTGKKVRMSLGRYPDLSLADARKKVAEYKKQIGDGEYPRNQIEQKKIEVSKMITFSALADRFITARSDELKQRTFDEYVRIINKELRPILGKQDIRTIRKIDLAEIVDKINTVRKKPTQANRVLAVASAVFTYAVGRGLLESHPATGLKKNPKGENKRERVYTDEEIQKLWEAIEKEADPLRTFVKFLLATGQRKTETASACWEYINFDKRTWTIPAEHTKNGIKHTVPLSSLAIDLLKEIKPLTGASRFVFTSPKKEAPLKWLDKAKQRIAQASGISDFMYHNIRRTFATNLASMKVDRTTLGKLLNHKSMAKDDLVTAIYDRHTYMDEMQLAVENWGAELMRIVTGQTKEAKITRIGGI
jgi:integrase